MAVEKPDNDRSLELDEVVRRFAESETLLNQTGQHLRSLLAEEQRSDARARSLSETARAVEDYSTSAKLLLDEVRQNVHRADEILQAGAKLLDNSALTELSVAIESLGTTQSSARREAKQELARLRDFLQRSIQESHAKHTRKLWIATVVLLVGQAAAAAVVVSVMMSP